MQDAVLAAPLQGDPQTAAVGMPTLNGKFASARSRHPTDSHPATGSQDPDDSDTSRCLARALTAQVYDSLLLRADVTRLGSLGDPPPLEDRGPLNLGLKSQIFLRPKMPSTHI